MRRITVRLLLRHTWLRDAASVRTRVVGTSEAISEVASEVAIEVIGLGRSRPCHVTGLIPLPLELLLHRAVANYRVFNGVSAI